MSFSLVAETVYLGLTGIFLTRNSINPKNNELPIPISPSTLGSHPKSKHFQYVIYEPCWPEFSPQGYMYFLVVFEELIQSFFIQQ